MHSLWSVLQYFRGAWDYSIRGLATICKDGVDSIGSALKELEAASYIVRNKIRDSKGRICDTEYVIYEKPMFGKMDVYTIDRRPYFPATACAKRLSYANPYDAVQRNCPNVIKLSMEVEIGERADGSKAVQTVKMNFIPEKDLMRLIDCSSSPVAKHFREWIFSLESPSADLRDTAMQETEDVRVFADEHFGELAVILIHGKPYFFAT